MRKINENDYVNYAKKEWAGMKFGTLYGNKPDGTRAILDTK